MAAKHHKSIGKKRGSVVLEDWYEGKEGPLLSVVPVGPWFDRFGPEEGMFHYRGHAVRMPSGRWREVKSVADGKRQYKLALRESDTRFTWAENIETAVRKALKKTKPRDIKVRLIDESVKSSYLHPGSTRDYLDPDPFHVYVFTEHGIGDPFHYDEVFAWFKRAAEALASDPWYEDAGWDSYRAGVAYFWIKPKMIS
jgi:hypothetical protein